MKILHTSDIHIGRNLSYLSLLEDQEHLLNFIVDTIKKEKVDALMICGDIYNSTIPSASSIKVLDDFLTKTILEAKIPVLMIAGNHDSPERLQFSNKILEKSGLYISADLKDEVKRVVFNDGDIKIGINLLPYIDPSIVKEKLNIEEVNSFNHAAEIVYNKFLKDKLDCDINILMAHGFFIDPKGKKLTLVESESNVGGSEAIDIGTFKKFDYIALGHLHSPQNSGQNGFYSGSPLKYSLTEVGHKKTLTLVEIDSSKNLTIKSIPVKAYRDVKLIEGDYDDIIKNPSNDYVFIRLLNKQFIINGMANLKPYFPNCVELQYPNLKNQTSQTIDIKSENTPSEIFDSFYENITGEKMTAEEKKLLDKIIKEVQSETN